MHGTHFILLCPVGTTFTWSQEGNFSDAVRPAVPLAAQEQHSFVPLPPPENTVSLDWMPQFPARVVGEPSVLACEQPYFAFAPALERRAPVVRKIHPYWLLRPFLQPSQHLTVTQVPPKLKCRLPLDWLGA